MSSEYRESQGVIFLHCEEERQKDRRRTCGTLRYGRFLSVIGEAYGR